MPRVSILLTCYNHLEYLKEAYSCIQKQTFTDYEIVAIDDGSTDGTREWLVENITGENTQVILNETNLGTYGSLNRALEAATGEFIAVFNDDDVWTPEKLAKQLELFDTNPKVGLVHTNGFFINGKGERIEGAPLGFRFPTFETGDILAGLFYENKIIASAALVRRECFEKLGGFNPEYFGSGDWEMWFRIALEYHVGFVDEPLTMYRVHGANASHKLEKIWKDDEKLRLWFRTHYDRLIGRFPAEVVAAAKAHNEACLGTVLTLNGNPSAGREAYRNSLKILPGRWKSRLRIAASYLPQPLFRKLVNT